MDRGYAGLGEWDAGGVIIGIDPGQNGAIAWLSDAGALVEVRDLPVTKGDGLMPAVLAAWLQEPGRLPTHAYVERVASRPGAGVAGMFKFGRGFGQLEGVLAALGVPVTLITPTKWKGGMKLTADKASSRSRAAQLWPGVAGTFSRVKDDGRAEASLIGLYGCNTMKMG